MAELTPRAQAKLLRALQDGEVRRLGENRTERLDLRVVAATNRPLDEAVERRPLPTGPSSTASRWCGSRPRRSASGARTSPASRSTTGRTSPPPPAAARGSRRRRSPRSGPTAWPGNVRELQNVLANLTLTAPRYGTVEPAHLAAALRRPAPVRPRTLAAARADLERSMVRDALDRHRNVSAAAGELGVTRQGLSRMMARLEIDRADPARERPGGGRSR